MVEYYSIFDREEEQASGAASMGEKKNQAEINNRKRRVNRIKRGIVYTVLWTIFILFILSVVLAVCTFNLHNKVQLLEREIYVLTNTLKSTVEEKDELKVKIDELEEKIEALEKKNLEEADTTDEVKEDDSSTDVTKKKEYDVHDHISYADNVREKGDPCRVYLTFDDGPSANTEKILDLLDKHGVKGTFFVNGKEDESLLPLYKEITDRGNTIGMHSYSHDYNAVYDSVEGFEADMLKLRDFIYEQTGVMPVYYRFPGGSSNTVSKIGIDQCIDVLAKYKIVYFDWNVQCGDATTASLSVDTLVNNVMRNVSDHKTSVVLMHDSSGRDKTVKALSIILDKLDEMDVEVLPITEDTDVIHHE